MNQPATRLPLETLSDGGKAPKSRVVSAADANQIADAVIYANQDRSRWNARLKGMFDGNPPYSPAKLKQEAQAWRGNVNFLEGKACRSAALVPYYDLFSGAKYYAQVRTEAGDSDSDKQYYSEVITEEFDRLLKGYDGFDFNMQQMLTDMVGYGRGFLMWQDNADWRFRCVPQHRVYVPDGTDAYSGNLELLVVRQQYRVHELFGYISDPALAREIGWNVKGVTQAIINAMPETQSDSSNQYDFEWLQQRIKDHDLTEGTRSSTVSVRHLLVKEFNGKVSHYIVEEYKGAGRWSPAGNVSANAVTEIPSNYLYTSVGRVENFRQSISTFFMETLDGSWNGATGLGHDIFSVMALKDRIKCAAIDLMFLRTGVNLQAKTANAMSKAALTRFGPVNIIPPDFEVQQATILGDIESPVVMDRLLDQVVTNNTGIYRQRQEQPQGNPRTAEEVRLQYQTQAMLSNAGVNRFYGNLDPMYAEVFRRASNPDLAESDSNEGVKAALYFQKCCRDRGVPPEALKKVSYVRAYRNAGNGSLIMRQQNIAQTMQLFPLLPENGKQNFLDYALSSINGQTMADLFNPKRDKDKLPGHDVWEAMVENANIKIGAPVQWTPEQNDVIHAQTHLGAASAAAQTLQQGAQPEEVAMFLDGIGRHMAVHLQNLSKQPQRKNEFDALEEQWKQLGQVTDQLHEQIDNINQQRAEEMKARQQAGAIQSGQDPETQIAAAKTQADVAMKKQKLDANLQINQAKADQKLRNNAVLTRQKLVLSDAKTAADIRTKRQKMAVDNFKGGE